QPDRPPSANVQRPTTQLEGARLELVYAAGRPERRPRVAAAWDRDVNGGRDRVEEAVAGQRRLPAQRCPGGAFGDLDQVRVGGRRIGPAVDASAERDDVPAVSKPVDVLVPSASVLGFAVGERVAEQSSKIPGAGSSHGRKSYPHARYLGWISSPVS